MTMILCICIYILLCNVWNAIGWRTHRDCRRRVHTYGYIYMLLCHERTRTHIYIYIYIYVCVITHIFIYIYTYMWPSLYFWYVLVCSWDEARIESQIAEDLAFYEQIITVDDAVLRAATLSALVCISINQKNPIFYQKSPVIYQNSLATLVCPSAEPFCLDSRAPWSIKVACRPIKKDPYPIKTAWHSIAQALM